MKRAAFYSYLRSGKSGLFGTRLSQRQVEGLEPLLNAVAGFALPHAAHVLAECYHETGGGMYPVKETVFAHSKDKNPSDATVIARLDRAWSQGALPWVKEPYWRDGMFGRGQIQITHEYNYRKCSTFVGVDLVADPDKALVPAISAVIAAQGCARGTFTGKKLADFDGPSGYDHYNARAIVNGDKNKTLSPGRKMGHKMQEVAKAFEAAITAAGGVMTKDRALAELEHFNKTGTFA